MIRVAVTKFSESRAFKINRKINPNEKEKDRNIFFKKILKVAISAKKSDTKNKPI